MHADRTAGKLCRLRTADCRSARAKAAGCSSSQFSTGEVQGIERPLHPCRVRERCTSIQRHSQSYPAAAAPSAASSSPAPVLMASLQAAVVRGRCACYAVGKLLTCMHEEHDPDPDPSEMERREGNATITNDASDFNICVFAEQSFSSADNRLHRCWKRSLLRSLTHQ